MLTLASARYLLLRHLKFIGPGLVSAVAYIDPGNWATDLSGGASYGYKLLFIVFVAGLAAVVLQVLAVRLGAVTATSLASQIRLLFLRLEAKYPKYRRALHCCLWILYILAEIAIIGTDLAELIGSAIALNLLFPKLPLFAGVLITACDVLVFLFFFRSATGRQGMLFFEFLIVALVLIVFGSFIALLHLVKPNWGQVFFGIVPSKTVFQGGALYDGIGIIGATVMPHALFIGSSMAGVDRLDMIPTPPSSVRVLSHSPNKPRPASWLDNLNPIRYIHTYRSHGQPGASSVPQTEEVGKSGAHDEGRSRDHELGHLDNSTSPIHDEGFTEQEALQYEDKLRRFDRISWVDVHVMHASIDTAISLLGFALTINSAILTVAGAAYYFNRWDPNPDNASIGGAFTLLRQYIGDGAAIIFALGLLCAGQSASITATLAGQVVSEGFINWRTSPFVRRLVTRAIGVVPAAVVASSIGASGLNAMLVASQVLLSIVLPFVMGPLVYLTSRADVMTVQGPEIEGDIILDSPTPAGTEMNPPGGSTIPGEPDTVPTRSAGPHRVSIRPGYAAGGGFERTAADIDSAFELSEWSRLTAPERISQRRSKCYKSPLWLTTIGWVLFVVLLLANSYVIVELGLGQ